MRVCVIAFANLMVTPYIKTYTDILREQNIDYDIIYWNRYKIEETVTGCSRLYEYKTELDDTKNLFKKIYPMLLYAKYVRGIVKKEKYDKIIILTSLPGVLLESFLVRCYKGKYIFDIRDHSYEHIKWYYNKMDSLMKNSMLNVISSEGFMKFLPSHNYTVDHNCNFKKLPENKLVKKQNGKIVISFVGNIRYEEECKKFLNAIKNNEKIEFHFYGRGEGEKPLKEFCRENKIENVKFFGAYKPEDKEEIINNSDLLFNAYGNESIHVIYALSNKYYESMYYKKPLIVNSGTTMAELSKGTSFEVDYNGDVSQELINWYNAINEETFQRLADNYLKSAIDENENTRKKIAEKIMK